MDRSLRGSSAHVLVADVERPVASVDGMHHLRRVLRLRDGEPVTVTDGAGRWRVCAFGNERLEPVGEIRSEHPTALLTIAVAAPKGDRLEWLIAKCTEVGVDRIVLLDAERSVVRWKKERVATQLDRLRRVASEAAMQSRRVWLPEIAGPVVPDDILSSAAVAEPGGRPVVKKDVSIAVGPEGGWSPDELALATDTVSLGPNVLRVETAAVAAAVLMVRARE